MSVVSEQLYVQRPWLLLYGIRLKVPTPRMLVSEDDLAPLQRLIPEELMNHIFSKLGPYALGKAACVCRQFRALCEHPKHWEAACKEAFAVCYREAAASSSAAASLAGLRPSKGYSWRRTFLNTPRVRFDGIYVARNTYIRQGVVEWRRERTVHLVSYFRYFRFLPDGTLLYRTSPSPVAKVVKSLQRPLAALKPTNEETVQAGKYLVKGGKVFAVVVYPSTSACEIRSRLVVRSTCRGACNRLDVETIYSYDRQQGAAVPGGGQQANAADGDDGDSGYGGLGGYHADEEGQIDLGGVARKEYRRGLAPFVFVPWEQVNTHVLNLPASQMDIWLGAVM